MEKKFLLIEDLAIIIVKLLMMKKLKYLKKKGFVVYKVGELDFFEQI